MTTAPTQLRLFDLPTPAATRPGAGTLAERALSMLLEDGSLDHPTFQAATGSWCLAEMVFKLRRMGWPVESSGQSQPTSERPARTIAVYRLTAEMVAELRGQQGGVAA